MSAALDEEEAAGSCRAASSTLRTSRFAERLLIYSPGDADQITEPVHAPGPSGCS